MNDDTTPQPAFVTVQRRSAEPSWLYPSAVAVIRDLHNWSDSGAFAYMLTSTQAIIIAVHSREYTGHDFTKITPESPWQPHRYKLGTKIHFKVGGDTDAGKIDALVIGAYDDGDNTRKRAWGDDKREWVVGYVVDDEFVSEANVIEVIGKAVSND